MADNNKADKVVEDPPEELPSLQDRTAFLGILTCIVASSYDYHLTVEGGGGSTRSTSSSSGSGSFLTKFMDSGGESNQESSREEEEVSMYLDEMDTRLSSSSMDDGDQSTSDNKNNNVQKEQEDETAKRARVAKIQQKLKLAEERYLVRRYQVALQFIKNAAHHLLLAETDETLQKEFLPMLDDLLESSATTTTTNRLSWRKSSSSSSRQGEDVVSQVLQDPEKHAEQQKAQESKKITSGLFQLDWVQENPKLQQFLEESNPETSYKCLCWLLFQHLLHATDEGYDARVRYWFKSVAVTLWMQQFEEEEEKDPDSSTRSSCDNNNMARATRKFESLEHCMATRLLTLAASGNKNASSTEGAQTVAEKRKSSTASNIWRGVQVGGVGVLAGTLLAVTGGLAAPGIAAGLAALGMGAVAGTFLTLASSAAVVSIFGVATGGLAAYKMNRRVSGLSEFTIEQELIDKDTSDSKDDQKKKKNDSLPTKAELFRTIGISGWLNTKSDFQKPWGVTPTNPPIKDKVELLQRFYQVHNPELIPQAEAIWKEYKHDRDRLWQFLRDKYGVDPDHIFDKDKDKPGEHALTAGEETTLDSIIVAIGNVEGGQKTKKEKTAASSTAEQGEPQKEVDKKDKKNRFSMKGLKKSILTKTANAMGTDAQDKKKDADKSSTSFTGRGNDDAFETVKSDKEKSFEPPAHLATVWNYEKMYGGELYTIRWESDLLREICDSVRDLALDLASKGGQQVLKYTVASTLMIAAALPITIISAMGSIDGTWTLAIERSDEAGKELARSLLYNKAGHRPVTLVGYSFGARVIFSCLKELAQYQQKWEEYQIKKKQEGADTKKKRNKKDDSEDELEFDREPASIVEDVIMMGMPKYLNLSVWKAIRQVVAGRLVNVFSRQDKILSLMFKYKRILGSMKPVVGTCTVAVPGVENIDVTDLIAQHQDYVSLTGEILKRVRHGQPLRASSNAIDEEALMKEAENLAKKNEEVLKGDENQENASSIEGNEVLREWK